MERILIFLYHYRTFITFVALEIVCAWLVIQTNEYHGSKFFNSSNSLVARVNSLSFNVGEYFSLRRINEDLARENVQLREALERQNERLYSLEAQHVLPVEGESRFDFVGAKVLDNTVDHFTNYLTIDKGSQQGVEPGMAVVGPDGIVGKVRACSGDYSVVTSILNINVWVSATIERTGHFGTVQWDGRDPNYVKLEYIPRHIQARKGDRVVTSGFNSVFPSHMLIGTIEEISLSEQALDLSVRLSQDFRKLAYVAVIMSERAELDSLQEGVSERNP